MKHVESMPLVGEADQRPAAIAGTSRSPSSARSSSPKSAKNVDSKADSLVARLRKHKGLTIDEIVEKTGWQRHSVRAFLSATVKKKLGLNLSRDQGKDGLWRYRIVDPGKDA